MQQARESNALVDDGRPGPVRHESPSRAHRHEPPWPDDPAGLGELFAHAGVAMAVTDGDGHPTVVNDAFCSLTGWTRAALLGDDDAPENVAARAEIADLLRPGHESVVRDVAVTRPDGRVIWVRRSPATRHGTNGEAVLRVVEDVTCRLEAEGHVANLTQALRTVSAGNSALLRADDAHGLTGDMCRVIVEDAGHALAWVGLLGDRPEPPFEHIAVHGRAADDFTAPLASPPKSTLGPIRLALRERRPLVIPDVVAMPSTVEWKAAVERNGHRSIVLLPVVHSEHLHGVMGIHSETYDAFDAETVALLSGLAADLAFGLDTLRARQARERAARELEESLEATIAVITTATELRDPYTAGHQRRVGALAEAIGLELGLDADEIKGVTLAATIHDIGKIAVPTEVLAWPGRLSPAQRSLVQEHPQRGYDIVQTVEFRWPVAEMIRQHHERLDGSGYPRGLRGDELHLGARIIAVADTVEAMFSHRPYRPALGLDAALATILTDRGTKLDERVVDACVAIASDGRLDAMWRDAIRG